MQLFCIYIYIIVLFNCSAGGVELLAKQGRIKVVNTLESRLEMMSKQVCNYILYWSSIWVNFLHTFIYLNVSFIVIADDARD